MSNRRSFSDFERTADIITRSPDITVIHTVYLISTNWNSQPQQVAESHGRVYTGQLPSKPSSLLYSSAYTFENLGIELIFYVDNCTILSTGNIILQLSQGLKFYLRIVSDWLTMPGAIIGEVL